MLCWNLINRSISAARLMYDHITWIGDAHVVDLPRHIGDQKCDYVYPKHANSMNVR